MVLLFDEDPVWHLPRRFGLYAVCAPGPAATYFAAPLRVLKEVNLHLVEMPFGPEAITRRDAFDLAIRYFFRTAQNLGLEFRLKPTDREAARREKSATPVRPPFSGNAGPRRSGAASRPRP